jgi:histone acetyltransferase (RNA polymerase elongator complex component)
VASIPPMSKQISADRTFPRLIIPVFITHDGCPHRCIFCDQHVIAGRPAASGTVSAAQVTAIIDRWLARPRKHPTAPVEVAFFGGSFTGLTGERQQELLDAVAPYITRGRVETIRLSTRPDYIRPGTAAFLRRLGVGCVELGVQSLAPEVLAASGRNYNPECVERAVSLLREASLAVGLQLMVGLPGETTVRLIASVRRIAALRPDFVRIYPALVIRDTGLDRLYRQGKYLPLTLSAAVARTGRVKAIFDHHNIKVVRMGLQPSTELEEKVVAGPYHPAFGELVASRMLFKRTRRLLMQVKEGHVRRLSIAPADLSAFRGPGNRNMKRLKTLGLLQKMELVCDPRQRRQTVLLQD